MKRSPAACLVPALASLLLAVLPGAGGAAAQAPPPPDEAPPAAAGGEVTVEAPGSDRFTLDDVFGIEWAMDPRIAPDGRTVVYARGFMDAMHDRMRWNLWRVEADGSGHRPLTSGLDNHSSPRWSPSGDRLAWIASDPHAPEGGAEIWMRWMASGESAPLTRLPEGPADLAWSPDGRWLAFSMWVPEKRDPLPIELPEKPEGAEWADPARVIDEVQYRADGAGWIREGHTQVFVVPADGGTPRQLTSGPWEHGGRLAWRPDGEALVFSANRRPDWEKAPADSELWEVRLEDGELVRLTDRRGPDGSPAVSPDGRRIAYVGFDDRFQGHQTSYLYVLEPGGEPRRLTGSLDRDVESPVWSPDGSGIYFQYDDRGDTKIGFVDLDGNLAEVAGSVGGVSFTRPYGNGSFTVAELGSGGGGAGAVRFAFTLASPDRPADVAVGTYRPGSGGGGPEGPGAVVRLTDLNQDLFGHKELGRVEELWWESSADGRRIQGWLVTPPGYEPGRRYPLVLEIHGGPFADYGPRFAAEIQLYAAAGYAVLYANPRGSTGYGGEFANLIHHAYPGDDYHDLMSGVDAVVERGVADPERLYVTGGSGGGVLTSWIVGKTDRFRAAVVAKPVINWTSFVLTADFTPFFHRYWFPGFPWDHPEHYFERSPLSLAGNVSTPTMVLVGGSDLRTPVAEAEQFYQALRLQDVPTMLVRLPGASHSIASRPTQLMAKAAYVLAWFARYGGEGGEEGEGEGGEPEVEAPARTGVGGSPAGE